MAILKNDLGLIQLHKCPKCNYLVQWNDTVNEEHLCKWCAAEHSVQADGACAHEWTSIAQDEKVLVCMLCGQETPRR